jgi:phosphate-selective porin OprO/OprP
MGLGLEPADSSTPKRLPPVSDSQSLLAASPAKKPETPHAVKLASFATEEPLSPERFAALEARVRELEAGKPSDTNASAPAEAAAPEGVEIGSDKSMTASWNHGLNLESKNKDFKAHVGGRTQFDTSFFSNDPELTVSPTIGGIGRQPDSFQFRRGRLRVEGTMYECFDFEAEYDFVNTLAPASPNSGQPVVAVPSIINLWGTVTHLPYLGNVRIGNMKEPIGMEHQASSRFLPFIERSFLQDAVFGPFNNGFTPGVMAFKMSDDERSTWSIGWFSAHNNAFGYGIGPESAATGRLTWLPVYDESSQGRYLWHVGLAGSIRGADEDQTRVRTRGNIRSGPPGVLNPIYADTGTMGATTINYFAAETAINSGPLTVQAEFTGIVITDAVQPFLPPSVPIDRGTPFFYGGYVQALWFLTGEHSNYSNARAAFDRVTPYENFSFVRSSQGEVHGSGAWQIGVRYDAINLNADGINGGVLHGFTFGLNWYWNPNMKVQLNYDLTHRSDVQQVPGGFINAWGLRYAMDF